MTLRFAAALLDVLMLHHSLVRLVLVGALVPLVLACGARSGQPPELASSLTLTIDEPTEVEVALPLRVAGWAADLNATTLAGIRLVELLDGGCNGSAIGEATTGIPREDVAATDGAQFLESGWQLDVESLPAGRHDLAVRAYSASQNAFACSEFAVEVGPHPTLSVEEPSGGAVLLPFRVSGWALDLAAASGAGVDRVEVLDGGCAGESIGTADLGRTRGDLASRYGHQFGESGWQLLIDDLAVGQHVLGVQLYSAVGGAPVCDTITVEVL